MDTAADQAEAGEPVPGSRVRVCVRARARVRAGRRMGAGARPRDVRGLHGPGGSRAHPGDPQLGSGARPPAPAIHRGSGALDHTAQPAASLHPIRPVSPVAAPGACNRMVTPSADAVRGGLARDLLDILAAHPGGALPGSVRLGTRRWRRRHASDCCGRCSAGVACRTNCSISSLSAHSACGRPPGAPGGARESVWCRTWRRSRGCLERCNPTR